VTCESGHVTELDLCENQLSGPVPEELDNLTHLQHLGLQTNQLTGTIPPELGSLADLQALWLGDNQLIGGIPPELGSLSHLEELLVHDNRLLRGALPATLTNLVNLNRFEFQNTKLCEPFDAAFQAWLDGISNLVRSCLICSSGHLDAVSVSGPATGRVRSGYTFTATVDPPEAALPITFVWHATEQSSVTRLSRRAIVESVDLRWITPGVQVVTATVSNVGGQATCSHAITVCESTDVVCDCVIDGVDVQAVARHWGCLPGGCYEARYDINSDGRIDMVDVVLVAARWGCGCGDRCYQTSRPSSKGPSPPRGR
jgi:hypothetical protein